jgi:hypothetical protein
VHQECRVGFFLPVRLRHGGSISVREGLRVKNYYIWCR